MTFEQVLFAFLAGFAIGSFTVIFAWMYALGVRLDDLLKRLR